MLERIAIDLEAEAERDSDSLARQFMEGDFHTDAAHVPPGEEQRFLQQLWVQKPDQAVNMAQDMMPQDFFTRMLDNLTDLSPAVKSDFMTMLEGGVPYEEAVTLAQQMHDAEVMARTPLPPLPEPVFAPQDLPAPGPVPMAPPVAMDAPAPPPPMPEPQFVGGVPPVGPGNGPPVGFPTLPPPPLPPPMMGGM
jgi:hypothetical protein